MKRVPSKDTIMTMEKCIYCEQPLAETERVRWYSERVHVACYEELLANEIALIATETAAVTKDSLKQAGILNEEEAHF